MLSPKPKRKFRSDGTSVWIKGSFDGPGVWISCVKGKEKQTVGEAYDVFAAIANELWPESDHETHPESSHAVDVSDDDADESIEAAVSRELTSIKGPRKEQRFINRHTYTPCVVFISCKPPIDPVRLVTTHIERVHQTGRTQTRHIHRLVPVSASCAANMPEIRSLSQRTFSSYFSPLSGKKLKYKIEARMRNHNSLTRQAVIQVIAQCVPEEHTVDLENADIFILVEVFKNICGMSIVRDYYRYSKFNVMEIASGVAEEASEQSARVL